LVSFQANCAGDKVNVTWTTASEHNTSHYIVEHSRNGNDWYALTMLAAAGNATSLLDYTYVHENPNTGTNYYRLTQYDNDGVFEQFNAVAVDCDNINKTATLSTYPNPSEGSFYISLFTEDMKGAGVITITDTKGTVVYTQDVNIQNGNTIFHMDNLNVAPGMYYIQVANGNTSTDIVKHSLR
jgi:plastocyanin